MSKLTATIVLIASFALSFQSVLAVDHVHLEETELQSCLACSAYGPDTALTVSPAPAADMARAHFDADAPTRAARATPIRRSARGPPQNR